MGSLKNIIEFIEYDSDINYMIEPENRFNAVKDRIFDVINNYKPGIIVKIGIGNGKLLNEIAAESESYIVVVEPSLKLINNFINKNENTEIKFINGEFHDFPIDYYAADLIICVDYLDFLDSGNVINEFKRALQFDGLFLFAGVVLHEDDIEGVYDDYIRIVFPLHNDYYLASDLKTFLELKELSHIKSMNLQFTNNLHDQLEYFQKIFKDVKVEEAHEFIQENSEEFINIMKMEVNNNITEPYYIGLFMRLKPKNQEK